MENFWTSFFSTLLGAFLSCGAGIAAYHYQQWHNRKILVKFYAPILREELKSNILQLTKISNGSQKEPFVPYLWLTQSLELCKIMPKEALAYQRWLEQVMAKPLTSYAANAPATIDYDWLISQGYNLLESLPGNTLAQSSQKNVFQKMLAPIKKYWKR